MELRMETTRLSTKGQLILPKAVRDAHGWRAGTEFSVHETQEGVLLKPVKPFPETRHEDVFGCLKWDGPPKTIEEMDQAITDEIRERHARGEY